MATGRYSVLRGTSAENEYGDEVESQDVHLTNVIGSVIEKSSKVYNPSDSRVVTVRTLTGRFAFGTDIQDGDRIKDEKTNVTYLVSSVNTSTSLVNNPDLVVELTAN
jgi:hypothetical protein